MGHFARARDTRGCVDEKSFEKLKKVLDKWGKMVYNVSCQGECDPASEGGALQYGR